MHLAAIVPRKQWPLLLHLPNLVPMPLFGKLYPGEGDLWENCFQLLFNGTWGGDAKLTINKQTQACQSDLRFPCLTIYKFSETQPGILSPK